MAREAAAAITAAIARATAAVMSMTVDTERASAVYTLSGMSESKYHSGPSAYEETMMYFPDSCCTSFTGPEPRHEESASGSMPPVSAPEESNITRPSEADM